MQRLILCSVQCTVNLHRTLCAVHCTVYILGRTKLNRTEPRVLAQALACQNEFDNIECDSVKAWVTRQEIASEATASLPVMIDHYRYACSPRG